MTVNTVDGTATRKRKRGASVVAVTSLLPDSSTLSDPTFSPFWSPSVQTLAQRLWLPTASDSRESEWSAWRGCSSITMQRSWFNTPLLSMSYPRDCSVAYSSSMLTSWLATTPGGPPQVASETEPRRKKARTKKKKELDEAEKMTSPPKPKAGKTRRIRVYPTRTQKHILARWFGTARWTYNQCLTKVKEDRANLKEATLRALVINNACHEGKETAWVLETPYMVRQDAMFDLVNAYTSNFARARNKKKNNEGSHQFTVNYRTKKAAQESIYIEGRKFNKGTFYTTFFGKTPLKAAEPLPDKVDYDCRLTRDRLGRYHLCIPQPLDVKSDNQAQRIHGRVAALDPGIRTFHAIYDTAGYTLEVGKNDIGRIYRMCHYLDDLDSRRSATANKRSKYRMRKAMARMRLRIRNLVDECHKKVVKFLLMNYDIILLPSFETHEMVTRRRNRVLSSKSARALLTWSHFRFKQRLLFKRQEYPWCHVVICDEAYTTKTCGRCGKLHNGLKSAKTFVCPSCGLVIDRDANAARNVLLKNSSLFGFAAEEALGLTPSPAAPGNRSAWSPASLVRIESMDWETSL